MSFQRFLIHKKPIRSLKAANALIAAVEVQAADVAAGFEERVAKVLRPDEEAPDVAHLMDVVARLLRVECRELLDVDEAGIVEGTKVSGMQRRCRVAKAEVRAVIVDLRKFLVGLYGAERTAELLGVSGRTPRGVDDLVQLAGHLLRRLPGLELPAVAGVTVDPAAWERKLTPPTRKLEAALAGFNEQSWEKGSLLRSKKQAVVTFDSLYSLAVRLYEILYYLAGRKFLGARLRPRAIQVLRGGSRLGAVDAAAPLEDDAPLSPDAGRWPLSRWIRKISPRRPAGEKPVRTEVA